MKQTLVTVLLCDYLQRMVLQKRGLVRLLTEGWTGMAVRDLLHMEDTMTGRDFGDLAEFGRPRGMGHSVLQIWTAEVYPAHLGHKAPEWEILSK